MTSEFDKVLADTHALIWYFTGSSRLSVTADQILQRAERGEIGLIVPTIVLAEAISVSERKNPGISIDEILDRLARMRPP
jgi:predicted nucleic acid-binding protein